MKRLIYVVFTLFVFSCSTQVWGQTPPTALQAGGIEASRKLIETQTKLREDVSSTKEVMADSATVAPIVSEDVPEGEKTQVNSIEVEGSTKISTHEINKVISPYIGKTLSMRDMQEAANKITELYRQAGFITTRAIIPAQKMEGGVLKIEVVEGRVGSIEIRGNKYFSKALIQKMVVVKQGEVLDYEKIKASLGRLNEVKDRQVKSVITPGQEPRTTDILLNVKDQLPLHLGLSYDNYGSRYLGKNRYQGSLTHNNLTGHDDVMTVVYQIAEGHNTYRMSSLRYMYPVTNDTQLGVYVGQTQLELGREYADLGVRGKSKIYSIFLNHKAFSTPTTTFTVSAAFDYKDVTNFILGNISNQDRLRVARLSGMWDHSDTWGRTIINNEIAQGIPGKWGANENKDEGLPPVSRAGSGGLFTKDVIDILRLQPMPKETTLLLKGQAQLASHILTATEQFQLGGIANVRGFAAGEAVGDTGQTLTGELSLPFYGLSKNMNAPFSKAKLYDSLRWAVFYDWGRTSLRRAGSGERKDRTLDSAGLGLRFDLPEDFSMRIDIAWPLSDSPSDQTHAHTWVKVSKDF